MVHSLNENRPRRRSRSRRRTWRTTSKNRFISSLQRGSFQSRTAVAIGNKAASEWAGCSAGSITALQAFFSRMPGETIGTWRDLLLQGEIHKAPESYLQNPNSRHDHRVSRECDSDRRKKGMVLRRAGQHSKSFCRQPALVCTNWCGPVNNIASALGR